MSKKNKAISVEISNPIDNRSEVKVNKVVLGHIMEQDDVVTIEYAEKRSTKAPDFDTGVSMLIAEYNLHH